MRLLVDFIERQLPPEVHAKLERHLSQCPRCLAQVKTYESTVSLLRSVKEDDLPGGAAVDPQILHRSRLPQLNATTVVPAPQNAGARMAPHPVC